MTINRPAKLPPQNIRQFLDLTERATDGGTPCYQNPKLFFSFDDAQTEHAKWLCLHGGPLKDGKPTRCPVIAECFRFAIDSKQEEGVWAGTTGEERRAIRKREAKAKEAREAREAAEREANEAGQDTLPIPLIEAPEPARAVRRNLHLGTR